MPGFSDIGCVVFSGTMAGNFYYHTHDSYLAHCGIYLPFCHGSLNNIISLTSLSIAIGMVVDDAIVVLEILQNISKGKPPEKLQFMLPTKYGWPFIVTTLTVVAFSFR